ncbi:MAG: hypothetical protein JJU26_08685 [Oceanicaulis sp.]|uniref:hypothetical protein n=1 Tax=Glycocaulis sp. TaxID=1969725 RepID=UPI0025C5482C|nr:hypothetical protein [Glycocaulis sp.]MCC5981778.1 hypothetical protein [Oceanicaulis sp.]MCH8522896.1 hypothetical protein [Glycocaulis sp.]
MNPASFRSMTVAVVASATSMTLFSGAVYADTVRGSIDGEAREWHVLTGDDGKTVNFSELSAGIYQVTVQAHRQDRYEVEGSVSLTFTVMDGTVLDAEAMYFPQAGMFPHYTREEAGGGLEIERMELTGATGRLVGRFEGELVHRASMFSELDESNVTILVLEFEVSPTREG